MTLQQYLDTLPVGFKFFPTDEHLLFIYLRKKVNNEEPPNKTVLEVDLHTRDPSMLPDAAKLNSNGWYFTCRERREYGNEDGINRATMTGFWKSTGNDETIVDKNTGDVGMKKTLVFYTNGSPDAVMTSWTMYEYRLQNPVDNNWVLCKVLDSSLPYEPPNPHDDIEE
ncbi:hypothetical protein M569_07796 [Genlisea aurea]|uniref:NAC domain-containing protein n=1 Tax=Genlisea aurea TaxID=192259 RepID=S8DV02_9LAMI|nr:hypothetical protein M569_07796 [Genlisea aurea]